MLSSRPISVFNDGSMSSVRPKTPARGLGGRENAGHPHTVAKGKGLGGKNAVLHTPFHAGPSDGVSKALMKTAPRLRPLVDKTPAPNRNVRVPGGIGTLDLNGGKDLDSVLRPSSLRKNPRTPRGSLGKGFETPINNSGNYWDVSDVSITAPDTAEPEVKEEVDDFDEVEYGPPNTLDAPYTPPFDFELPNYREVGANLASLSYARVFQDEPSSPVLSEHVVLPDQEVLVPLPDLVDVDDPFYVQPKLAPGPTRPQRSQSQMAARSKPVPKPIPGSRSNLTVSRPATSASVRRPTTASSTTTAMRTTARPQTSMRAAPPVSTKRPASRVAKTTAPTPHGRVAAVVKPKAADALLTSVKKFDEDFLFDV